MKLLNYSGQFIIVAAISFGWLIVTTKNMPISILVAIVNAVFVTYHSFYLPKQMEDEQHLYKDLQKYSTSMVYYLNSGHNVLKALELSKVDLDKRIARDINKTIKILERKTELKTDHFKKYNFIPLNLFHQLLEVKYVYGGESTEIFNGVNRAVNFEIVKRDKVFREKQQTKNKLYLMLAIALGIPFLMAYYAAEEYLMFIESGGLFPISLTIGVFIFLSVILYFIQKNASDISIRK